VSKAIPRQNVTFSLQDSGKQERNGEAQLLTARLSTVNSEQKNLSLENSLTSKNQPSEDGQNIFFVDTIRMKRHNKKRSFTARQACAVESAGNNFMRVELGINN
jgi:hypothetical protein